MSAALIKHDEELIFPENKSFLKALFTSRPFMFVATHFLAKKCDKKSQFYVLAAV